MPIRKLKPKVYGQKILILPIFLFSLLLFLFVSDKFSLSQTTTVVCDAIRPYNGTQNDASALIQKCINDTPANGIVELPAGKYYVSQQIRLHNAVTFRTQGKDEAMPRCSLENHDCAELIASESLNEADGLLINVRQEEAAGENITIDHIVINGNKDIRATAAAGASCKINGRYGINILLKCSNCKMTNSVSKNALCGASMLLSGKGKNVVVSNNLFAFSGVHDKWLLWSDGLSVHDSENSVFTYNEIIDGTDVDFIFGGCINCTVKNNRITHTDAFSGGSYAGLMIHAWPLTSGNYTGSEFSNNYIDCSSNRRCGFGILIGSEPWYTTDSYGGSVHDNTIRNAQQGINIDDVHDFEVYNNKVELTASVAMTSCGLIPSSPYNIGPGAKNIDTSKDGLSVTYTHYDWKCLPNYWRLVSSKNVKTSFTELNTYHSGCTSANMMSDLCKAAIKRYCSANGYISGFGPIERESNEILWVTCITSEAGQNVQTTFTELKTYIPACDPSNPVNGCISAIKRFCVAKGYESGFGPVEHSEDSALVTCTKSMASKTLEASWSELSQQISTCTFSNPLSEACNTATGRLCRSKGNESGFGPVEYLPDKAWVTCVSTYISDTTPPAAPTGLTVK